MKTVVKPLRLGFVGMRDMSCFWCVFSAGGVFLLSDDDSANGGQDADDYNDDTYDDDWDRLKHDDSCCSTDGYRPIYALRKSFCEESLVITYLKIG